ncbi:fatty acid desaturase [Bacillus anthracis]|nr:fatty acid desaturase [Bacillus anthracis]
MNSEQVLQVTKGDFLGSLGGAVVLTSFIVFFSSVLV